LFKENKQPSEYQTNWKGNKEDLKTEECTLSLTAKNSKGHWCVDSGCSRHMTRNKNTFQTLQVKSRTVTFNNDNSSKILGKGIVSLGNKDIATKNVLLIENMKHNLLSVSQMCDQGQVLMFTSKDCKIRREELGKLVATSTRSPKQHIYTG
jgi:hypothetical protein